MKDRNHPAINVEGVSKRYGDVQALDDVSLTAPPGQVFGLLGPNGAGKTTLVRILTTLATADEGTASVAGINVRDAGRLRANIGLAGQYAAVDELLTGTENLELVGGLYGLAGRQARSRAAELLERFGLTHAAGRTVRTYSGGMRRRLDLAASLVNRPPVLLLDEPTTGLDPASRQELWQVIEELVADGTSVLLTTQYLEEADRLANTIAVIDHGRTIAEGTADQLKDRMGGDVLDVRVPGPDVAAAAEILRGIGVGEPSIEPIAGRLGINVPADSSGLVAAVRQLDAAGIAVTDLALRRPTLDDVFLSLTGSTAHGPDTNPPPAGRRHEPSSA